MKSNIIYEDPWEVWLEKVCLDFGARSVTLYKCKRSRPLPALWRGDRTGPRLQVLGPDHLGLNLGFVTYWLCHPLLNLSLPQFPHLQNG